MKIHPPLIASAWLLITAGVSQATPGLPRVPGAFRPLAALPFAGGGLLGLWALWTFRRHRTTYEPFETPAALVVAGPYRFTRNPMYVGLALVLTGIALASRRLPLLLAPLGFVVTINATQIPREEALLAHLFGPTYADYRRRVPRWL